MALWDLVSRKQFIPPAELFWRYHYQESRCIFESNDLDVMLRRIDDGLGVKQILLQ